MTHSYVWLHDYDAVLLPGHILQEWLLPNGMMLVWAIINKEDYAEC